MTNNDQRVDSTLLAGGTVVVPSRQRALAIALAYARARLAQGLTTWAAPDVLPYSAWLARSVDADRSALKPGWRRLGGDEEWLLWRAAARAASADGDWLQAASLAEPLRDSLHLRRDWGLTWRPPDDAEEGFQSRALQAYAASAAALRAVSPDDWALLPARAGAGRTPLLFAGFEDPGRALQARVESLGGEWLAPCGGAPAGAEAASGGAADADSVHVLADRGQELLAAALWCRERLAADPDARLLVVAPQLAQWRARAQRVFARVLHGAQLLAAGEPAPLFAIEGGQPLADYPLARALLGLCALAGGEQPFEALSALLRNPYLSLGAPGEAAQLELALRERHVTRATLGGLARFAQPRAPGVAATLLALEAAAGPARDSCAAWAPRIAGWLALAGWPRAPLGSAELQVRVRCDELLGQFAQLSAGAGLLTAAGAAELLAALATRVAFEPASEDVPVTLTASTGDPLVRYDGIRVLGLNAESWPRPAQPDPFLPVPLQRAAGLLRASAAGQHTLAVASMAAWRVRGRELVYSCARSEDDAELQPSSLLGLGAPGAPGVPGVPGEQGAAQSAAASGVAHEREPLVAALHAAARLEPVPPARPPAWPAEQPMPGGTRALTLQSECPFQAYATLRLGAARVAEPQPGLPASERGRLLHDVLQRTWESLGGSEGLAACTGAARTALVAESVHHGMARLRARLSPPPAPLLLEIEARRVAALVEALLVAEGGRVPFTVEACERKLEARLGGVRIDVRVDRIDRLADGRFVVLDYKSGRAQGFDPLEERPGQAQLLAYALLVEGEPAGLATVHLRAGEVSWCGGEAAPGILPALKLRRGHEAAHFPQWLAHWRRVVPRLAADFAGGEAGVAPRTRACERCHLAALCRVDAEALAAAESVRAGDGAAADADSDGGSDAGEGADG